MTDQRANKGCPNCANNGKKQKWSIVLDPTTVADIDRELLQDLHRRVDYLIEPAAKGMNLAEAALQSAQRQVVEATEHHVRVYDFGEKHKGQLLVPKEIQDEQQVVQRTGKFNFRISKNFC